jgi:2-oxoglutarate ferredoxin oxidoreductase subunit beta
VTGGIMESRSFHYDKGEIAWCPGCGNFSIRKALIAALEETGRDPRQTVLVSGIGQAAKLPHYLNAHVFNGLHGRSLPAATAIKACNPELTVVVCSGDGDIYGEGGNHLLHAMRRNPDITLLVHDNMIYGLTKGQASPTTMIGVETPVQVLGVFETPLNPLALAIAMGAPFVARASAGDIEQTREIIKQAVDFRGFAMVDIFQPCVSFNKLNTFKWFKEHTYYLEAGHDPADRVRAFARAIEEDRLPLGIFFKSSARTPFEENLAVYKTSKEPLYKRNRSMEDVRDFMKKKFG